MTSLPISETGHDDEGLPGPPAPGLGEPVADATAERRARRSAALADAFRTAMGTARYRRAMDIGTGAGGVSPLLVDLFDELVLVDIDEEALATASTAVAAAATRLGSATQVRTALIDLSAHQVELGPDLAPMDVVYSVMALHHIADVPHLVTTAAGLLRPGGRLLLADLEPDGGLYHAHLPSFDGHDGFRRNQVTGWIQDAGLRMDQLGTAYVDRKPVDGVPHDLAIFVAVATRA